MKQAMSIFLFILVLILPIIVFAGECAEREGQVCLDNPLGTDITIPGLIGKVIGGILSVVGSLALAMFVYGGFMWMTAAGSPQRVEKGKNILLWAAIGLVIIFSSYALVALVFQGLGISDTEVAQPFDPANP